MQEQVKHISKENHFAPYDILSFNVNGSEKYIEIKSTKHNVGYITFFMSKSEYEFAKGNKEKYIIARVWDVKSNNPKIMYIENPLKKLYFETKEYVVFLKMKK